MRLNDMEFLKIYEVNMQMYRDELGQQARVFVQKDVKDIHVFRIIPNTNEEYDYELGTWLLEYEKLNYSNTAETYTLGWRYPTLQEFLEEYDNFECWEVEEHYSLDECIERIHGEGSYEIHESIVGNSK